MTQVISRCKRLLLGFVEGTPNPISFEPVDIDFMFRENIATHCPQGQSIGQCLPVRAQPPRR